MVAAPAVGQGLPSVPTPSLPAVPTVVPQLPQVPALPKPTLPSTPSLPHVPSVPAAPALPVVGSQGASSESVPSTGGSGSGGATRGSGRTAAGGSSSGGSVSADRAAGSGGAGQAQSARQGGSVSAATPAADRPTEPRARAEVRRDRRLRAKVRRLEGCVGALPRPERRVLTLRAGLGRARPRTRQGVAQALQVSPRRVGRLERRAVRRLRTLVRAGGCSGDIAVGDIGGGTMAATLGELAATGMGAGSLALYAARELKRASGGPSDDRVEVKSERESSGRQPAEAAPPAAGPQPPQARPLAAIFERGGADLTLPLLILVALVALLLAVRAVRRSGAV